MKVARLSLSFFYASAPDRVWKAFVGMKWWPRDFHTSERTRRFVLEPEVGGRMFEDFGGGAGLLWYTVVEFDPPRGLSLAGHVFPEWGGPALSLPVIRLEAEGRGTRFRFSDSLLGVRPATLRQLKTGWTRLLGRSLQDFLDRRPS